MFNIDDHVRLTADVKTTPGRTARVTGPFYFVLGQTFIPVRWDDDGSTDGVDSRVVELVPEPDTHLRLDTPNSVTACGLAAPAPGTADGLTAFYDVELVTCAGCLEAYGETHLRQTHGDLTVCGIELDTLEGGLETDIDLVGCDACRKAHDGAQGDHTVALDEYTEALEAARAVLPTGSLDTNDHDNMPAHTRLLWDLVRAIDNVDATA